MSENVRRICFLFLAFTFLLITTQEAWGQNHLFVGSQYHYGTMLAHTNEIKYVVYQPVHGGHVQLTWKTNGSKYWHKAYNKPYYGIGFYHSNLGNEKIYGRVYGFYPYFKFPITNNDRRIFLNHQVSAGYAFIDKIYDPDDNLLNLAIGNHSNIFIKFGFELSARLTPNLYWDNGFNFIHASNGKVQSPNLGLNMGTLSTGFRYQLREGDEKETIDLKTPTYNRFFYELSLSGGFRVPGKYVYKRYLAGSLVFDAGIRTSYKRSFGAGIDIFYDRSIPVSLKREGREEVRSKELYKIGLHGFHDIYIENLVITLQLGYHVYSKYTEFTDLFTRTGIKYHFSNNLWAKFALKAHYFNADFIEWGIGYRW